MNGERPYRLILVRLERTKEEEGNRGHLVFAIISSAYADVCADDFGFIIGSDVGGEKEGDTKSTEERGQKG